MIVLLAGIVLQVGIVTAELDIVYNVQMENVLMKGPQIAKHVRTE